MVCSAYVLLCVKNRPRQNTIIEAENWSFSKKIKTEAVSANQLKLKLSPHNTLNKDQKPKIQRNCTNEDCLTVCTYSLLQVVNCTSCLLVYAVARQHCNIQASCQFVLQLRNVNTGKSIVKYLWRNFFVLRITWRVCAITVHYVLCKQ